MRNKTAVAISGTLVSFLIGAGVAFAQTATPTDSPTPSPTPSATTSSTVVPSAAPSTGAGN